jgi:hypothetical protein
MSPDIKQELNLLADMMLMVDGYESCLDSKSDACLYDFSTSNLPRCRKSWNKAVTAYSFLKKQPDMLRFQVKMTAENILQFDEQG